MFALLIQQEVLFLILRPSVVGLPADGKVPGATAKWARSRRLVSGAAEEVSLLTLAALLVAA